MLAPRVTNAPRTKELPRVLALAATVVLLHFMLAQVSGYPVTLAPFALLAFLFVSYEFRLSASVLPLWSLLILLPFLNPDFFVSGVDPVEFMRTYVLWGFTVTTVLFASAAGVRSEGRWVGKAAFVALVVVTVYSVAQILTFDYLGSDALFNPFGSHQYLYQYEVELYADSIRAPGFYLEPSFNAFIVTSMVFIAVVSGYRPTSALILGAVALLAIQAMSGILVYAFVLVVYLIMGGASKRLFVIVAVGLVVVLAVYFSGTGEYVLERITSGSEEGSSTNYRIVAPLAILEDMLSSHVTGISFGRMEEVILSYGLALGEESGSSLDNGVYLLMFHFGWLAVGAVVLTLLLGALFYRRWLTLPRLYLIGYVVLSMNYSGAIFNPEYVLIIVLTIYAWRSSRGSTVEPVARSRMVFVPRPVTSFAGRRAD